ncbi:MAG: aldo/keto reductase [Pseudomonadota bacterium]
MEMRSLAPFTGPLPAIGLGTWEMEYDADPVAALKTGLELGMTHVDTAEMYGRGAVEEIVGKAIAGRRDEVFLTSKVLPSNASREGTLAACERSLKALRTDCLDLYLLHWPGRHPLEETLRAFDALCESGKIRAFGVSNFDAAELRAIVELAGPGRITCNQVLYHPGERTIETALLPAARELGVPLVAYSPFGHGDMLSSDSAGGRAMAEIARRRGVSVYQVALRFVLRHPDVLTIPKAATLAHVTDNAAAGSWELDESEIASLAKACPPPGRGPGIPML